MSVEIKHSLNFVTVVDETHPIGMRLLALDNEMRKTLLEGMLKELLAPKIQPVIDELNERGTYAILKVAD
jgi:hypothetical protein